MARHELRTWPEAFQAHWDGALTHTIRRCDRPFAAGETLLLREYDHARPRHHINDRYTGRTLVATVTCVSAPASFGLPDELCVMSIQVNARTIAGDRRLPPSLPEVAS